MVTLEVRSSVIFQSWIVSFHGCLAKNEQWGKSHASSTVKVEKPSFCQFLGLCWVWGLKMRKNRSWQLHIPPHPMPRTLWLPHPHMTPPRRAQTTVHCRRLPSARSLWKIRWHKAGICVCLTGKRHVWSVVLHMHKCVLQNTTTRLKPTVGVCLLKSVPTSSNGFTATSCPVTRKMTDEYKSRLIA